MKLTKTKKLISIKISFDASNLELLKPYLFKTSKGVLLSNPMAWDCANKVKMQKGVNYAR